MTAKNSLPEKAFIPKPFIFVPLPTVKTDVAKKTVGKMKCIYSGSAGFPVPYTKNDRIWLVALTTAIVLQKKQQDRHVELGRVSDELRKIGQHTGGEYIGAARKSLDRVYHLNVDIEKEVLEGKYHKWRKTGFRIGEDIQLVWASGKAKNEVQLYLDGMNYIELHLSFCTAIWNKGAVPIIQEQYAKLKGPRQQDIYAWLVLRLHDLKETVEVNRDNLLEQFYGKTRGVSLRRYWQEFKQDLYHIKTECFPKAKVEATDSSIILRPSPPLIEPDNRRAGYLWTPDRLVDD